MTTDTTPMADGVQSVDLKELKVREDQQYRLEDKAEIKKLAASIDEVGILHNFVTDPDGNICSGTRRYGALGVLKWDRPVPVRKVSKELADAIVLAANSTTQAPDPLRESALVNAMVLKGWSLQDIATTMCWEPRRVALLQQLQNLCEDAKKAIVNPNHFMHDWAYEWIELFAQIAHEDQRKCLADNYFQYVRDLSQLEHQLTSFFHVLSRAPWALDDATLVPTAGKDGTCVTCPNHSHGKPFLFDELEANGDLRKAVCQNKSCWLEKSNACAGRKITELRDKNPESVIVVHHGAREALPILKEHPTFMEHQVTTCAKTEKGAVPALILKGDGSMARGYVRKPMETASPAKAGKAAAAKKPEVSDIERLKIQKERLESRRKQWVVNHIVSQVREWGDRKPPSHEVILGFVAAFRVEQPLTEDGLPRGLHGNVKVRKELFALAKSDGKFSNSVWPRVRLDIAQSISPMGRGDDMLDDEYAEAIWLADILGLGAEREFRVLAEQAAPTPKSLLSKSKAAPKVVKKKKGARAEDGFQPESDS